LQRNHYCIVALAAAACASVPKEAPEIEGAPARLLESSIAGGAGGAATSAVYRCLFVRNDSGETAALFVDGRHVGWVGPRSAAGFYVGRSAGAKTRLTATCRAGHWSALVEGPAWEVTWRLKGV